MAGLWGGMIGLLRGPRVRQKSAEAGDGGWNAASFSSFPGLSGIMSASGVGVNQATAMSVAAVYQCVARRSRDVARCTPSLYRMVEGVSTPVLDHPAYQLFARPNPWQTWFEFSEQVNAAYLLKGNGYAVILRNGRGEPTSLIPVNPDFVTVLEASNGQVFYQVSRYGAWISAALASMPMAIPYEDMIHLRNLSFNSLIGLSRLGMARDAVGLAMAQEQQANRFVKNGSRPSGVLKTKKALNPETIAKLKIGWNNHHTGVENTGGTAVLEDGIEWQQLQLSAADLDFLKSREFQVLEICRFFDMPPHKLFIIDKGASQNIPQQEQDYVNGTIAPDLERWEQMLAHALRLDAEGLSVDFDENKLLRADLITQITAGRLGLLSGVFTPNEVRRSLRMQPLPGGDRLLAPSNTAALGSDMTGTAPDGAGRPAAGALPAPGVSTGGEGAVLPDQIPAA